MKQHFYSHGKLLLTGEYVVLDGALTLAIPTKYGQHIEISSIEGSKIHWKSIDNNGNLWFSADFFISDNDITHTETNNSVVADRLVQIFRAIHVLNPNFFSLNKGLEVVTKLEFPINWGLGTSSTLIHNLALWTDLNPYDLLERSFGGSGYDIACAKAEGPITYKLLIDSNEKSIYSKRDIKPVNFDPSFKHGLYFVHLNKKKDSREGISHYRSLDKEKSLAVSSINALTMEILNCKTIGHFQNLIDRHEDIIGSVTNQTPVKELLFPDFSGSIKSLGAWGGDFILVASEHDPTSYFKTKGFSTIIPYESMVL